jgi:hypothetical protein
MCGNIFCRKVFSGRKQHEQCLNRTGFFFFGDSVCRPVYSSPYLLTGQHLILAAEKIGFSSPSERINGMNGDINKYHQTVLQQRFLKGQTDR